MPTRVMKRAPRERKITQFADIGAGERVRWGCGSPIVVGHSTARRFTESPPHMTLWPSWAALFECYEAVRAEFLAWYEDIHGRMPGIEYLYECYCRGGDPARCELPQEPDPRLYYRAMR
jgi:hypothetical protein